MTPYNELIKIHKHTIQMELQWLIALSKIHVNLLLKVYI